MSSAYIRTPLAGFHVTMLFRPSSAFTPPIFFLLWQELGVSDHPPDEPFLPSPGQGFPGLASAFWRFPSHSLSGGRFLLHLTGAGQQQRAARATRMAKASPSLWLPFLCCSAETLPYKRGGGRQDEDAVAPGSPGGTH